MRKILSILIVLCVAFCASSCKGDIDLEMYLSELRQSVYTFEDENFSAKAYFEEREDPYINDGFVGSKKKFFVFKIDRYKTALDSAYIILKINGTEAKKDLEYSPLNGKFTCNIELATIEDLDSVEVTLVSRGEQYNLVMHKSLFEKQISYKEALKSVSKSHGGEIEKMLGGGSGGIESRVRILSENNRVYYYVSITSKGGKTLAFLVDGATASILAKK